MALVDQPRVLRGGGLLPPAINGTEQRLDLILAELWELRAALAKAQHPSPKPAPPKAPKKS